jgi:hypothetical protein
MANNEFCDVTAAPAVGGLVLVVVGTGGIPVPVERMPVELAGGMGAPEAVDETWNGGGTTVVPLPLGT